MCVSAENMFTSNSIKGKLDSMVAFLASGAVEEKIDKRGFTIFYNLFYVCGVECTFVVQDSGIQAVLSVLKSIQSQHGT